MDKLKPCPFCGSIATVSYYSKERAYQVKCTYCCASIPEFWNREFVVKAWNRREREKTNENDAE